jgi:hypothetical protein
VENGNSANPHNLWILVLALVALLNDVALLLLLQILLLLLLLLLLRLSLPLLLQLDVVAAVQQLVQVTVVGYCYRTGW